MKSKKLRRVLGIVVSAVMVFAMVPAMAMAEEPETVGEQVFFEGFEEGAEGWTFVDADGDGKSWEQSSESESQYAYEGSYCLKAKYNSNASVNNWAISPAVLLPELNSGESYELSMYIRARSDSFTEYYRIYVGTSSEPDNMTCISGNDSIQADNAYQKYTADLSDYAGQTIYVAVRHCEAIDMFNLFLDNVEIRMVNGSTPTPTLLPTTTTVTAQNTANAGEQRIDVTVKPKETTGTVTGKVILTITFPDGEEREDPPTPLNYEGKTNVTMINLPYGTYTVKAVYSGDDIYAASTSEVVSFTIAEPTPATYNITVNGGKAYSDGDCTQEITKAKQGDDVYIYPDYETGKYIKGKDSITVEPQVNIGYSEKAMSFKMPGQDVTVTITFEDQTPLTIDLTEGSAVVDAYAFSAIYRILNPDATVVIISEGSEYTLDLDKNGTDDVKATVKAAIPPAPPIFDMVVLKTTNSVKDEITFNELNTSPYWPITVKFAETPVETLKITTTKLANGTVGKEYSQKLEANYDDVTWRIEGELPEGLELDGNTISGTPTEKGSFPITVKAEKGSETDTKEFTITITEKASSGGGGSGIVSFILTYETNGGEKIKSESYKVGDSITLDKTPVKEGYTFTGWYSDKELTNKITSVQMNSSKTVYAGWDDGQQPAGPDENAPLMVIRIGSAKYQLKGADMEMDSAPFIDENDRTMLPVRVVANALGISDEDIAWDDETKTASFTRPDGKVVSCTVGEKAIRIDDEVIQIDTAPVIDGDRIFLPMRALFNAFNVSDDHIIWDGVNKTVTVTKEALEDMKSL